eukprot:3521205-Pleurochrysis_carterae.AAC.1
MPSAEQKCNHVASARVGRVEQNCTSKHGAVSPVLHWVRTVPDRGKVLLRCATHEGLRAKQD